MLLFQSSKESEKIGEYLDLGRKLKLCNMKETFVPHIIGAQGIVRKRLNELEIMGRIHPDYSIVDNSWNTKSVERDLISLNIQRRPPDIIRVNI